MWARRQVCVSSEPTYFKNINKNDIQHWYYELMCIIKKSTT